MRKYIQIISFLLAAVTLSGCENWLDVKPETEVNEDDMFNTEQGFMDALYGIYDKHGKKRFIWRYVTDCPGHDGSVL